MALTLYPHPFSSYCQKVLIALYENGTPFTYRNLEDEGAGEELEALWLLKRFPVLVDDGRTVLESSVVIEHLGLYHPGPVRLVPEDAKAALEVRTMDRFFDNYVMTPMQRIVADFMRPPEDRDRVGVAQARAMLARRGDGLAAMGLRGWLHPGRLQCGTVTVLRRLGP